MTLDTTLSDLAMERKRLEVEKLKLQLSRAQEELKEIKGLEKELDKKRNKKMEELKNLEDTSDKKVYSKLIGSLLNEGISGSTLEFIKDEKY